MTEDEARGWILHRYGSAAVVTLTHLSEIIVCEMAHQNLLAPSTLTTMWNRHMVDSAQLLDLATAESGDQWLDIGSGAGFPGLVIAALGRCTVVMVEPRKRRAAFLAHATASLGLTSASVICGKIEKIPLTATVISARAVAPLPVLFDWASHCASSSTRWVLPKGRSALEDVATARQAWHGTFHVEHSVTDPGSMIVVASGVTRR